MRKIKFKTEYVPLNDDVINQHKDFDKLMAAYITAPKPNIFKRIIKNKWTMFGGGLMTGAIVTSLFWLNQNHNVTTVSEPVVQEKPVMNDVAAEEKNNTATLTDSFNANNESNENSLTPQSPTASNSIKEERSNNESAEKENSSAANSSPASVKNSSTAMNQPGKETQKKSVAITVAENNDQVAENQQEEKSLSPISASQTSPEIVAKKGDELASENIPGKEISNSVSQTTPVIITEGNDGVVSEAIPGKGNVNEIINDETELPTVASDIARDSADNLKLVDAEKNNLAVPDNSIQPSDAKKEDSTANASGNISNPSITADKSISLSGEPGAKEKKQKKEKVKDEKHPDEKASTPDTSANAFLNFKWPLFNRDSTKQSLSKPEKKGLFAFKKDTSAPKTKAEEKAADDSMYTPRYAQVSFITPLSSNGIDGYKYMHYISLNLLQGYNGAVKGVEFGGLLNGVKGYVTGVQFAGLGNYAGGNLKGAQFGGLANVARSVRGAQFGGIANVSGSYTSGFQAAGIANFSADSMNGFQAAGIINMLSSLKKSQSWQVAGIGNISLAQSTGGQISGVFNVANKLDGGQIGLINIGKNIKGFQIGLINISDSISGVPIGLISVSRHGIFDVNAWTSDVFTFNGAVRVGSKYVYNIYAYGTSPFKSDLPFGFGIGIGGHIPIKKAFIDMDGMAWSVHRSYLSFFGVNMINQFRLMGGFTFNKYFSVFAGPTFNVGVQDSRYDTFHAGSLYEHNGANTTVYMWPGFVAGVRLF